MKTGIDAKVAKLAVFAANQEIAQAKAPNATKENLSDLNEAVELATEAYIETAEFEAAETPEEMMQVIKQHSR